MTVQFAKTYIDRALDTSDLSALYDIVNVLNTQRELSEPLKLFMSLCEWIGATRSGIWQYYEGISIADFEEIMVMMEHCNLTEIGERYRAGMECWEEPCYCDDLDKWMRANESMIEGTAMQLIAPHREQLYPKSS